jgi:ketosteroid isomerase-like protein
MTASTSDVKTLLDIWSNAIRQKDINRLMQVYSPDIVYFDVVPPLRLTGADAVRRNFVRWFDSWATPIGVEIRDRVIFQNGEIAAAHMLWRTSGAQKTGRRIDCWIRASVSLQRSSQGWRITHEHVSLPVELPAARAAMERTPELNQA